ncbi:unnamed protein product [Debaryomyces tyrocola]|nr:unnamed protein product [Debaryomyces tyrocola]
MLGPYSTTISVDTIQHYKSLISNSGHRILGLVILPPRTTTSPPVMPTPTMLIRNCKIYTPMTYQRRARLHPSGHYTLRRLLKCQDASSTRLQILLYCCIVYRRFPIPTISQLPSKYHFPYIFHLIPLIYDHGPF